MSEYKLVEGFDFSDIVYEKRPGAARISFNRPKN